MPAVGELVDLGRRKDAAPDRKEVVVEDEVAGAPEDQRRTVGKGGEPGLDAGQRLVGPVMQEILNARDDDLVARVTRCWMLPCEVRLLVMRWREEQELPRRPESVSLLTMAQAFATELVHAATCTPGLVAAAREAMNFPGALVERVRTATPGIETLLERLAPPQLQEA